MNTTITAVEALEAVLKSLHVERNDAYARYQSLQTAQTGRTVKSQDKHLPSITRASGEVVGIDHAIGLVVLAINELEESA